MTTRSRTKQTTIPLVWNPILNRTFQMRSDRKSWHIVKEVIRAFGGAITSDRKHGPVYTVCGNVDPTRIPELKQLLYTELTFEGYQYTIATFTTGRVSVSVTLDDVHSEINTFNQDFFPAV